ncbi:MAG: O-antigen ligase family protein [bacterium]|nr:O-antigen ligase family protein [bacterium]
MLLRGGMCLLFFFVSFVPHRYLLVYGTGSVEMVVNNLAWLPSVFAAGLCLLAFYDRERRHFSHSALFLPVGVCLVLNLLGAVGAEVPGLGLSREMYYFLTGALLGLLAFQGFQGRVHAERFLVFLFAVSACVAGYGIFEFIAGYNPLWGHVFREENVRYAQFAQDAALFGRRIRATVGHPVFLGAYLLLCLPVGVSVAAGRKGPLRLLCWIGVGIVSTALLLTFSRGAWIGAVVAGIVYFRQLAFRHIALVGAVLVVFLAGMLSFDRVWNTLEGRGTVAQLMRFKEDPRGVAYLQVAGMIQDRPFGGIGTAHYRYLAGRYQDYDDTPDNMYLRLIGENGIVGFGALLALFVFVFKVIKHGEDRYISLRQFKQANLCRGILASVCGFWVDLITCDALYFSLTRITFWVLVGVGYALAQEMEVEKVEMARERGACQLDQEF